DANPSRAVAQPGSVPEWGSGGRGFKSPLPDQLELGRRRPHTLSAVPSLMLRLVHAIGARLDMLRAEFEAGADTARSTDYPGSAKAILSPAPPAGYKGKCREDIIDGDG